MAVQATSHTLDARPLRPTARKLTIMGVGSSVSERLMAMHKQSPLPVVYARRSTQPRKSSPGLAHWPEAASAM